MTPCSQCRAHGFNPWLMPLATWYGQQKRKKKYHLCLWQLFYINKHSLNHRKGWSFLAYRVNSGWRKRESWVWDTAEGKCKETGAWRGKRVRKLPKPNLPPSQFFLGVGPAQENKYHLNESLSKIEFESPANVEPNTNNTPKSQQNSRIRAAPGNELWRAMTSPCTWGGQRGGPVHWIWAKDNTVSALPSTPSPFFWRNLIFIFVFFTLTVSIILDEATKSFTLFLFAWVPWFYVLRQKPNLKSSYLYSFDYCLKRQIDRFWTLLCPICLLRPRVRWNAPYHPRRMTSY